VRCGAQSIYELAANTKKFAASIGEEEWRARQDSNLRPSA
jgi:hypothetical protein